MVQGVQQECPQKVVKMPEEWLCRRSCPHPPGPQAAEAKP
jgi:hypothetical protein